MKEFKINEIFTSIQGEGSYSGQVMNFIRLSGCNLNCKFCDTNHEEHAPMDIPTILALLNPDVRKVCITGGEPTLHDLKELCYHLKTNPPFYQPHLETNGTADLSGMGNYLDFVSLSPKSPESLNPNWFHLVDEIKFLCGDQLPGWQHLIIHMSQKAPTAIRLIQPIHTRSRTDNKRNIDVAKGYVLTHPKFRLSLQIHKMIGVR